MKYVQFFAFLHNQCARFAPEVEVPEPIERVLMELNKVTVLAEIDQALVEPFRALLGPIYRDALTQGYLSAQKLVEGRIAELDAAREQLSADRETKLREAQQREQDAIKQIEADRAQLTELTQKIATLTQRLDALKQ